ncbi:transposase [Geobacter argillaceus]|uniref:REP element-mobilizing transposase RayT n=1 Tax=Geobacter argillaceus TaxID=345631 RepID=A0A562VKV2_9BACT|nr:transposase [Geobacter argillaceus]TWJ18394.1 REP element-mobilizing transposase RayT [Geobacter argillaceus]
MTVCVQGRECLFGAVVDGMMCLNPAGAVVRAVWEKLPERFPNVALDGYVVMANHFHGIIMLIGCRGDPCDRPCFSDECTVRKTGEHKVRPYGTATGSVGRIVQAFKSMTTNAYVHGVNEYGWPLFSGRLWQRNYYERVIRDDGELAGIREYIADNPAKWADDEENPDVVSGRCLPRPHFVIGL